MKQTLQLFIVIFLVTISAFSQEKKIQKGNDDFDKFAFINSRDIYLKVVENGYQSQELYQKLGDSYYFTADLKEAAKWYGLLVESYKDSMDTEYYFRYAQTLKSLKQYAAADRIMDEFYAVNPSDSRATYFNDEKNYLSLIEMQSGRFELSTIEINSENSDFAPSFYLGNLIFASNREERNVSKRIHEWNNQPFLDLYIVNQDDEKGSMERFSKNINSKFHESTAIITKDGNTIYFTRNNYTNKDYRENSAGTNLLKLYRSKKIDGKWEKAIELPFNSDEYAVAHPALSPDEKTLYFASDMPGGKGLSDLYKVSIEEDSFGTPESLGEVINTEGRETFPFIATNGDMYFSSDGHPGLGGLDVYVVKQSEDGTYGEGYNIGEPVNSSVDDFTFIINSTSGLGYFASNREGGMGSDDIYSFRQIEAPIKSCVQLLNGKVRNKENDQIIPGAKVVLLDSENNILAETVSSIDGEFNFDTIHCGRAYAVRANKIKYSPDETSFVTSNEFSAQINKTLYLNPDSPIILGADLNNLLDLEPIYFDLDKSKIRHDAMIELQKVITFMNEYPKLKIDIRSHTDSRAKDAYNLSLSERRNKATKEYIINIGGISSHRIKGNGYGETQLVNECSNGVSCSEEKHQLNRRSEFIIIEN